jgi:cytochrome c5
LSPEGLRAAQAAAPDATEEELESGRQVFIANCNTCHGYPDIREFEPAELREIVPRMADKAELDPSEGARLLRFVLGLRASQ